MPIVRRRVFPISEPTTGGGAASGRGATGAGVDHSHTIREKARTFHAHSKIRDRLNRGAKSTKVRARQADQDFATGKQQGLGKFKERPEISPTHRRRLGRRSRSLKQRLQELEPGTKK